MDQKVAFRRHGMSARLVLGRAARLVLDRDRPEIYAPTLVRVEKVRQVQRPAPRVPRVGTGPVPQALGRRGAVGRRRVTRSSGIGGRRTLHPGRGRPRTSDQPQFGAHRPVVPHPRRGAIHHLNHAVIYIVLDSSIEGAQVEIAVLFVEGVVRDGEVARADGDPAEGVPEPGPTVQQFKDEVLARSGKSLPVEGGRLRDGTAEADDFLKLAAPAVAVVAVAAGHLERDHRRSVHGVVLGEDGVVVPQAGH
mmetsp:Transcript_50921/g.94282  ORF Transcript_50921/g.94282 Transcript_50921/m.94282 type:complete len:250 (-) Transcript_50921:2337-3086(-)